MTNILSSFKDSPVRKTNEIDYHVNMYSNKQQCNILRSILFMKTSVLFTNLPDIYTNQKLNSKMS